MLWRKAWLETRWRFLIGLAVLVCSAVAVVMAYPKVVRLLPLLPASDVGGELGRRIREAAELARTYRGYMWQQWFDQNLSSTWTIFAVLLGVGGPLAGGPEGATLFTLSLPVSRTRLLAVRAATALAELLALALLPSLLIPLIAPAIGQSYTFGDVIVHGLCLFAGGTVFFSLAFLLSSAFSDIWRPLLIAGAIALVLSFWEQLLGDRLPFGIFHAMSGEAYFRTGALPWTGLLVSAALSAALLYGAGVNIARRDY